MCLTTTRLPPTCRANSARSVVLVTTRSCAWTGVATAIRPAVSARRVNGVTNRFMVTAERMRLVRPEREGRLENDPAVRRRGPTRRDPLVARHQLGELAGEPLEVARACQETGAPGFRILEPIEPAAEEGPPG